MAWFLSCFNLKLVTSGWVEERKRHRSGASLIKKLQKCRMILVLLTRPQFPYESGIIRPNNEAAGMWHPCPVGKTTILQQELHYNTEEGSCGYVACASRYNTTP
jgi:hypothetical protein